MEEQPAETQPAAEPAVEQAPPPVEVSNSVAQTVQVTIDGKSPESRLKTKFMIIIGGGVVVAVIGAFLSFFQDQNIGDWLLMLGSTVSIFSVIAYFFMRFMGRL